MLYRFCDVGGVKILTLQWFKVEHFIYSLLQAAVKYPSIPMWTHTYNKSSQGGVHLQVTWGCEEGMVDMVGHISCESPVVSTVLEEVENWHGAMREPMNKQGLKDSFCVVEGPAPCSDAKIKYWKLEVSKLFNAIFYFWNLFILL